VTLLRTGDGLVLIDTSNYAARDRTFALVRSLDRRPLFAAIYTHGHADHALGLPPFLAEARDRGWPRPGLSAIATSPPALPATGAPTATRRRARRSPDRRDAELAGVDQGVVRHHADLHGRRGDAAAASRPGRDRRPHVDLVARAAHPVDG
jgi:glyoxylase-like metal-dependent hydrolase (beta-lactamase superfamily II)